MERHNKQREEKRYLPRSCGSSLEYLLSRIEHEDIFAFEAKVYFSYYKIILQRPLSVKEDKVEAVELVVLFS